MAIDGRIGQELRELHAQLDREGKLLSRGQLKKYYATFRERFGPDQLTALDGTELLEALHDHGNRDSLVYWLEFKNDDEFPARFGGIAGGSALKFGIYRRKETGAWMTGSSREQTELSVDEAVEIARRHRDQLIRGSEILAALSNDASDDNYVKLQRDLQAVAPDVSDSAWGHKYFFLLYPEKLDDYHAPHYQRFHLIRLLQEPPKGKGRYLCGGRYVSMARELDVPIHQLTTVLSARNGSPYRYWRIGTTRGATGETHWPSMQEGGCVAIGWSELGSLSSSETGIELKNLIKRKMSEAYEEKTPQALGRKVQEVFNFVATIQPGDIVVACAGLTVRGIGRVTEEGYQFDSQAGFSHQRPVEWLSFEEWKLPQPEGLRATVRELRKYPQNLVEVERRIAAGTPPPPPNGLPPVVARIKAVLERKRQVILYGPPGTGKTYWAMLAARELAAHDRFGTAYGSLSAEQRSQIDGRADGQVRKCTFHPAYGYEDFIEGYRPTGGEGAVQFVLRDGIFKKLCRDARAERERAFFLVVDEINRGDIPRIFGELLTVLERDKRGTEVLLPLSGEAFRVPDNVYVIATMNTADRSIALLDTALRRRFGFIELMPDCSCLEGASAGGIPVGPWLDALNARIRENVGRDARNLQVGHAYLLQSGRPVSDFEALARIVREDIIPLLQEYCYEDYEALERILGKGLVDAKNERIHEELFDAANREDLTQALLEIYQEIVASGQAVAADMETGAGEDQEEEPEENDSEEGNDE